MDLDCPQNLPLSDFSRSGSVHHHPHQQRCCTHPDPGLGEVGPDGDLLPGAHVGVAVPLERGLQLLELLAGEMGPLPPLLLLQGAVVGAGLVQLVLLGLLRVCGERDAAALDGQTSRRVVCHGEQTGRRRRHVSLRWSRFPGLEVALPAPTCGGAFKSDCGNNMDATRRKCRLPWPQAPRRVFKREARCSKHGLSQTSSICASRI